MGSKVPFSEALMGMIAMLVVLAFVLTFYCFLPMYKVGVKISHKKVKLSITFFRWLKNVERNWTIGGKMIPDGIATNIHSVQVFRKITKMIKNTADSESIADIPGK